MPSPSSASLYPSQALFGGNAGNKNQSCAHCLQSAVLQDSKDTGDYSLGDGGDKSKIEVNLVLANSSVLP